MAHLRHEHEFFLRKMKFFKAAGGKKRFFGSAETRIEKNILLILFVVFILLPLVRIFVVPGARRSS